MDRLRGLSEVVTVRLLILLNVQLCLLHPDVRFLKTMVCCGRAAVNVPLHTSDGVVVTRVLQPQILARVDLCYIFRGNNDYVLTCPP